LSENYFRYGSWSTVAVDSVSEDWIKERKLLICRGQMNWYIFKDTPGNRAVVNRWNKENL
jgi:hypothetical protein